MILRQVLVLVSGSRSVSPYRGSSRNFAATWSEPHRFSSACFWALAKTLFPFRFGNITQTVILLLGILALGFDLAVSGLTSLGGRPARQLLPAFMLYIQFFSLAEGYTSEFISDLDHKFEVFTHIRPESKLELAGKREK